MPTTRTKKTRGRVTEAGGITHADYIYFTWGAFFDAENYENGKTKEEIRAFWKKNRAAIMAAYLEKNKEKKLKGDRPWPFWEWEAPEPRRKIGKRSYYTPYPDQKEYYADVYEDDFDYLKRLGLLEPWEKKEK